MSKRGTTPTVTDFVNMRFAVNDTVQLSISSWQTPAGQLDSVGLFRKTNGKWELDHETVLEIRGRDDEDTTYRSTDYGYKLVCKELGHEPPLRYFRDNRIGGK